MNRISLLMEDFLKEEELEVFSNRTEGFSSLKDDEEVVAVINPVGFENLYIQSCDDGAVLAFGNWRQEYDTDAQGIQDLKRDIEAILQGDSYVWSVVACKKLMVSLVDHESIRYLEESNLMDLDYMSSSNFLQEIAGAHGQQDFLFWNPETQNPSQRYFLA